MPCTERLNLRLLFAKVSLSYCIQGSPVHENVPQDNSENTIFHHIGNITIYFQFFQTQNKNPSVSVTYQSRKDKNKISNLKRMFPCLL